MASKRPALFRGRHFRDDIIVLCVRSYLRYPLSYRDLEPRLPPATAGAAETQRRRSGVRQPFSPLRSATTWPARTWSALMKPLLEMRPGGAPAARATPTLFVI